MKRVFLDENVDPKLEAHLAEFQVSGVLKEGWSSVKNGELISLIESSFDVLLSHDKGLEFQQNWTSRSLVLIVLRTKSNRLDSYSINISNLIELIRAANAGVVSRFDG